MRYLPGDGTLTSSMIDGNGNGQSMTNAGMQSDSIRKAVDRARDTGRLDLSGLGLTDFPREANFVPHIHELLLGDNLLQKMPREIKYFSQLTVLNLDGNDLESLPQDIGALTNLQALHLDSNRLDELPAAIGRLANLRILTANSNEIRELPEELGLLVNLESLMLSNNQIASLPMELGRLRNLRRLWLDGNQITDLGQYVAGLERLQKLSARDNLLTRLPREVGKMRQLRTLTLSNNMLTALPPNIGQLENLEMLDLQGNILSSIPHEVGRLAVLRDLLLDNNKLNALPRALAPLLINGLTLSFSGNPVTDALIEIANRGADALASYLASLDDAVSQYEAKVMLVGEGNVGKTSLVAALHDEEFVSNRDTTHGIEIRSLSLRHPTRLLHMTLRTWDFGGQEVYRITHQFFFSKRALYLLVWSAREGQEQDEVEGWLSRIRLRVAGEASTIIIATHCSERNAEIDMSRLQQLYPGFIAGMHEIDNRTALGIAQLRQKIALEAARLPQMGQLISPRWIATRDDLERRAGTTPQISFSAFNEICRQHGVADREVRTLAELLHDLGQIIYYGDDEGLRDIVVLDPEWLTRAISYVLEDKLTREAAGMLDHRRLSSIWSRALGGTAYPAQYHRYFLRLMEKFDVSYRMADNEQASLVAQLVPHQRPSIPWQARSTIEQGKRALAMICRLSEPAPGLMAWLTVRHHQSSVGLHWRRGVFLRHPIAAYDSEALLDMRNSVTLALEVRAPSPDLFFNVLRDGVEHLIRTRWPGIKYRLFVPCPSINANGTPCCGEFPLEGLLGFRESGGVKHACLECLAEHDVSMLLTGFETQRGAPLAQLERLQLQVDNVAVGVRRLEEIAADTAQSVRRVLVLASTEVLDCPRLFTISSTSQKRMTRRAKSIYQDAYQLVLWCEHTGHWHPWQRATYELSEPKEWLTRVRPYAVVIYSALRVIVPVAAAVSELGFGDLHKAVEDDLSVMESLLQSLPIAAYDGVEENVPASGQLAPAEGEALRSFRVFLFQHDPARAFGGLRRVQGPSGEVLWVCPIHHSEYDPGLPDVP
jgi:internalin A